MSEQRPHMLVVCDHGDTKSTTVTMVARFVWHTEWWHPIKGSHVDVQGLYGDTYSGYFPERMMPGYQPDPGDEDLRTHYEITCPETSCTTFAYRTDDTRLQVLLTAVAGDDVLRGFAMSAGDSLIVLRLQGLHLARKAACHRGLRA